MFSETNYKNFPDVMENIKKNYSGAVKFRSIENEDLWQKAKKARLRMSQKMIDDLFSQDAKEHNAGVESMESSRSVIERKMSEWEAKLRASFDSDDEEGEEGDDGEDEEGEEDEKSSNYEGNSDTDGEEEVIITDVQAQECRQISTVLEQTLSYEDIEQNWNRRYVLESAPMVHEPPLQLREWVKNLIMEVFQSDMKKAEEVERGECEQSDLKPIKRL